MMGAQVTPETRFSGFSVSASSGMPVVSPAAQSRLLRRFGWTKSQLRLSRATPGGRVFCAIMPSTRLAVLIQAGCTAPATTACDSVDEAFHTIGLSRTKWVCAMGSRVPQGQN